MSAAPACRSTKHGQVRACRQVCCRCAHQLSQLANATSVISTNDDTIGYNELCEFPRHILFLCDDMFVMASDRREALRSTNRPAIGPARHLSHQAPPECTNP
jgi:hypothetical protein